MCRAGAGTGVAAGISDKDIVAAAESVGTGSAKKAPELETASTVVGVGAHDCGGGDSTSCLSLCGLVAGVGSSAAAVALEGDVDATLQSRC